MYDFYAYVLFAQGVLESFRYNHIISKISASCMVVQIKSEILAMREIT
jgi:hypothetical protein